jgi:hypothetical protein
MLEYVGLGNLFLNSLNNTIDLVCMQFLKLYPILLFPPERVKNNSLNEVYQYIWLVYWQSVLTVISLILTAFFFESSGPY